MVSNGSFLSALPTISLFAFAGYRLMPALQQVYSALTQIRYATPSITALSADLSILKKTSHLKKANVENVKVEFQKHLVLENISLNIKVHTDNFIKLINGDTPKDKYRSGWCYWKWKNNFSRHNPLFVER